MDERRRRIGHIMRASFGILGISLEVSDNKYGASKGSEPELTIW